VKLLYGCVVLVSLVVLFAEGILILLHSITST
jgi:hypothetical protein